MDLKHIATVLVCCIVFIERWRLAQASQVLEQVCITRFRGTGFNEQAPQPCTLQDDCMTVHVSANLLLR